MLYIYLVSIQFMLILAFVTFFYLYIFKNFFGIFFTKTQVVFLTLESQIF